MDNKAEQVGILKEAIMAHFKALPRNLSGETEENRKKPRAVQTASRINMFQYCYFLNAYTEPLLLQ
jgi:hypothetical protein